MNDAKRQDKMTWVDNPRIQTADFVSTYPPLETDAPYLLNKGNGQLYPNTAAFRARSDAFVPYYGEVSVDKATGEVQAINEALNPQLDGEMASL